MVYLLLAYVTLSLAYAGHQLGNKYRKDRWYDFLLMIPTLSLAHIFAFLRRKK